MPKGKIVFTVPQRRYEIEVELPDDRYPGCDTLDDALAVEEENINEFGGWDGYVHEAELQDTKEKEGVPIDALITTTIEE